MGFVPVIVSNNLSTEYVNRQTTIENISQKQDNLPLKLDLTAVKQERSHSIVETTTQELGKEA